MTNTSRKMGNALEYIVCQSLSLKRVRPLDYATRAKMARLRRDYSSLNERHRLYNVKLSQLMQVYDMLGVQFGGGKGRDCKFSLNTDAVGAGGDATDVVLHTPEKVYRFSVKHNNMSIKHQRANSLWRQLGLRAAQRDRFLEEYAEINDRWVKRWRARGHELFNQVRTAEKFKLYEEVNELTQRWLMRPGNLKKYMLFVLGTKTNTQDTHILRWDVQKEIIDVEAASKPQAYAELVPEGVELDGSFLHVRCNGGAATVKLRLHTASSRITDALSLKYDTTVVHAGSSGSA